MAQTEEPRLRSQMLNSLLCSEHCRNKIALMRAHNSALITDYNSAMAKCTSLRENNKILYEKIGALKKVTTQIHLDVNQQNFDTSSDTVRNLCDVQLAFKENKGKGLGYKKVRPPYNHNYSRIPTTEQELENYDKIIYGKPSDYVQWEPFKPNNAKPTDFQKPMSFVKNMDYDCSNESVGKSEQENET
ncbi:hypothetical protein Hanom_Chr04g00346191 [Helianthus anomalus]